MSNDLEYPIIRGYIVWKNNYGPNDDDRMKNQIVQDAGYDGLNINNSYYANPSDIPNQSNQNSSIHIEEKESARDGDNEDNLNSDLSCGNALVDLVFVVDGSGSGICILWLDRTTVVSFVEYNSSWIRSFQSRD